MTKYWTWCTPEIQKAKRIGYELKTVHEVWHFDKSKEGLFAEYVNTWLKIKTEASGMVIRYKAAWPSSFIKQFEAKEGIPLEYAKIKKNPGLKATAKLMLNSNAKQDPGIRKGGFTLNVRGKSVLNYDTMKKLVHKVLNYTSMKDHILSTLEDEEDHLDRIGRWKQQPSGGDQPLSRVVHWR